MKRQLTLFVILGLLASGSLAKADLLFNGNWDLVGPGSQTLPTPVGWTVVTSGGANPSDSASSEDFGGAANVFAPGGKGVFYKTFQGTSNNPVSVNVYQNVAGSAGLSYTLTGWAGAGSGYSGFTAGSGTLSQLSLLFLGSSSNVLGSVTLDLQANGLGVGAPTPPATAFNFHPFTVGGVSPAGTVSVQSSLAIINAYPGPQGGDAAFVGDWLTLVPEPSIISLAGLSIAGLLAFRRRR